MQIRSKSKSKSHTCITALSAYFLILNFNALPLLLIIRILHSTIL